MDYLNNMNPEMKLQTLLGEAKFMLREEGDLNKKKEDLYKLIEQVDYLLGKHDDIYTKFSDVFAAMADFDFSKKLPYYEDGGDNFVNFVISGINILNEEFQSEAMKKKILHDFFDSLKLPDTIAVFTDHDGFIQFANSGNTGIDDFNEKTLADQSINILFSDFAVIEKGIKANGSITGIETIFKWKGKNIPAKVDVTISNTLGKIESLIYTIKLARDN